MKSKKAKLFNWLVSNYYNRVYRTAFSYMKNREDAQDICQDVFLKALEKLDLSRVRDGQFPILFIITKNLCLNRLKSKGYGQSELCDWDLISKCSNPEEEYIKTEQSNEVNRAINLLSKNDREIILLKHYQECSYKEIGEILDIPIGTVMSRLYSARKRLNNILGGYSNE